MFRGKCIVLDFSGEKKQGMEYDVSLHIKKLEKEEQIKPKVEKKKNNEVRVVIDETENWQTIKSARFFFHFLMFFSPSKG